MDVVVIGAGPSGLMAAVCLARLGVEVAVIDTKSGPTRESRALALQARSLEIYDQLGLAQRVLGEGAKALALRPCFRDRPFHPVSFDRLGATVTPFPGVFVLEQSRNERILVDALKALGGAVQWRHELTGLSIHSSDPAVELSVTTPEGPSTIRARWAVAADGASSAVRRLLSVAFEGATNALSFFVVDALDAVGLSEGDVNVRVAPDDLLLSFPMGGRGHHRILGVVEIAEGSDDAALERGVRARIQTHFRVRYTTSSWFAHYRVHHRVARQFRMGPVFLIGDAAHVHSPVGAQGMNTGLQDAHNLACKLAAVAHGEAPADVLDEYEAERRPVAVRLIRTTDAAFARVTSTTRFARFVRGRIVPVLAPLLPRLLPRLVGRARIYGYLSQTRIRYRTLCDDPEGDGDEFSVGRRLSWTGDNYDTLRSFAWQVHSYGGYDGREAKRVGDLLGVASRAFPPDRFRRLKPGRLYLVRPDGFVVAAADPAEALERFTAARRATTPEPRDLCFRPASRRAVQAVAAAASARANSSACVAAQEARSLSASAELEFAGAV